MNRSIYVISYDVCDNARRRKIARYLEGAGRRVQESVFETFATMKEAAVIIQNCAPYLNEGENDSLRTYRFCANCAEHFRQLGGVVCHWGKDFIV